MAGMKERRSKGDCLVVSGLVLFIVLGALGAYVGCYFGRSEVVIRRGSVRVFKNTWEADLFEPARQAESWFRGEAMGRGTER